MEILKIVGIGIITTIVIIIIKQIKPEFAVVALISGVIIMLYFIFSYFGNVLNVFKPIIKSNKFVIIGIARTNISNFPPRIIFLIIRTYLMLFLIYCLET